MNASIQVACKLHALKWVIAQTFCGIRGFESLTDTVSPLKSQLKILSGILAGRPSRDGERFDRLGGVAVCIIAEDAMMVSLCRMSLVGHVLPRGKRMTEL